MKVLHTSGLDFPGNGFSFATATTTPEPGIAAASYSSYPVFSTKSFQSYTTISPPAFNTALEPSVWPNHPSKTIEEAKRFGKQPGGKFLASFPSPKVAKDPIHHLIEELHSKSGPNSHSKFALPKRTSKVNHKEAPAGFLQDLPEDDLVTVLEALKEAIAEVDVD